jgi:uncharacterized protein DUF1571
MDRFDTQTNWLVILAVAVGVAGCTTGRTSREPPAQFGAAADPAVRKETPRFPPPQPAAALMIADPPAVAAKEPGRLPFVSAPPSPVSFKPEPSPLPRDDMPRQVEPANNKSTNVAPATLPALVARQPMPVDPPPADAGSPIRMLARKAAERSAQMDNYVMRMRRREFINGSHRPEEIILCKIRRQPFSVYMKWLGHEAKGREVSYVRGKYENKLHTLLAAGDVPLMPAGKVMSFAVDSPLVQSNSRYPITNAGLGNLIERFNQLVDSNEKGDTRFGTVRYLGQIKRPEFEQKLDAVVQVIPPQADKLFPAGGKRLFFFDPELNLPVLVVAVDDREREVEYYCHDLFLIPGQLDDADFDPAQWKQKK